MLKSWKKQLSRCIFAIEFKQQLKTSIMFLLIILIILFAIIFHLLLKNINNNK